MAETGRASDDMLMLSVQEGQTGLFAALFRRYRDPVFNYLRRMIGDYHRAQELTQDVFVHALRARKTYEAKGTFRAWLFRIATNVVRSEYRRQGAEITDPDPDRLGNPNRTEAVRPGDPLEADERKTAVQAALMKLSSEERSVVVLRHWRDMRFSEIAKVLDVNEATVKSRGRRALQKLSVALRAQMM